MTNHRVQELIGSIILAIEEALADVRGWRDRTSGKVRRT